MKIKSEECCPEFNPEPWDGKTFEWNPSRILYIQNRLYPGERNHRTRSQTSVKIE